MCSLCELTYSFDVAHSEAPDLKASHPSARNEGLSLRSINPRVLLSEAVQYEGMLS